LTLALGRNYATNAPIQLACFVDYLGSKAAQLGMIGPDDAIVDPIPAGEVVEADAAWPHAVAARKYGDVCRQTSVGGAFAPTDPGAAP
jgi:hypothetical protein